MSDFEKCYSCNGLGKHFHADGHHGHYGHEEECGVCGGSGALRKKPKPDPKADLLARAEKAEKRVEELEKHQIRMVRALETILKQLGSTVPSPRTLGIATIARAALSPNPQDKKGAGSE